MNDTGFVRKISEIIWGDGDAATNENLTKLCQEVAELKLTVDKTGQERVSLDDPQVQEELYLGNGEKCLQQVRNRSFQTRDCPGNINQNIIDMIKVLDRRLREVEKSEE